MSNTSSARHLKGWIIVAVVSIFIIAGGLAALGHRFVTQSTMGLVMFPDIVSSERLIANLESDDRDLVMSSLSLLAERSDDAARKQASDLLSHDDDYIWLNSTLYLGAIDEPDAIPHLIRALGHRAWRAHDDVTQHLERMTGQSFGKDQDQWIEWWEQQNTGVAFDFGMPQYEERARELGDGNRILINGVADATQITHMGAKLDIAGVELTEGADPDRAKRLLQTLVLYEFVEIEVERDLTPEGARTALVYWIPHPMEQQSVSRMRASRGLPEVPFDQRTLINAYLAETELFDAVPETIVDDRLRTTFTDALEAGSSPLR